MRLDNISWFLSYNRHSQAKAVEGIVNQNAALGISGRKSEKINRDIALSQIHINVYILIYNI